MKTIKEGLDEAYKKAGQNAYFGNGFNSGVEFAQRFIPIEEKMPPIKKHIIFKHHNGYVVLFFMSNYFREKYISYYQKGSWRPINIK
jgi:hypothetical protein